MVQFDVTAVFRHICYRQSIENGTTAESLEGKGYSRKVEAGTLQQRETVTVGRLQRKGHSRKVTAETAGGQQKL